jgi:hypothetical protein
MFFFSFFFYSDLQSRISTQIATQKFSMLINAKLLKFKTSILVLRAYEKKTETVFLFMFSNKLNTTDDD